MIENAVYETNLKEIPLVARGKVRDIYDLGKSLLIVATDRISAFDVVLDFSDMESLSMIKKLPKFNFDMKNNKEFSALKQRASELNTEYTSYDDLVDKLCDRAYSTIKNNMIRI